MIHVLRVMVPNVVIWHAIVACAFTLHHALFHWLIHALVAKDAYTVNFALCVYKAAALLAPMLFALVVCAKSSNRAAFTQDNALTSTLTLSLEPYLHWYFKTISSYFTSTFICTRAPPPPPSLAPAHCTHCTLHSPMHSDALANHSAMACCLLAEQLGVATSIVSSCLLSLITISSSFRTKLIAARTPPLGPSVSVNGFFSFFLLHGCHVHS